MIEYFMECIYCQHSKLYELKSGQMKCAKCQRKFSPKKIKKDLQLIECFCENNTANEASKKFALHYLTVKKRYSLFRSLIANFLENGYKDKTVLEYDEYIYLEKSKQKVKQNIFDGQNFLSFHYENKIYNLLLPNLNRYKNQFLDERTQEAHFKEFSKFMIHNKISKTKKRDNLITQFWLFFEDAILKYKGVSSENFFYYLKEIEFKFNYTKSQQHKLLTQIMQHHQL